MFNDTRGLIERCIRREEKAWGEFIEQFSGLLYYSAREKLKRSGIAFGRHDIEDIVQGIFFELWQMDRLREVVDRKKITAWLSIVTQNRALNYARKKKEELLHENELYRIDNIKVEPDNSMFLTDELDKAMEDFGIKEKVVMKSNIIHGRTHKEIAGFMKIPINTVSTIIARKKPVLKRRLKKI
ncbi:RNA polymerase sigma factor [Candidatus Omnitrophota bacterium]